MCGLAGRAAGPAAQPPRRAKPAESRPCGAAWPAAVCRGLLRGCGGAGALPSPSSIAYYPALVTRYPAASTAAVNSGKSWGWVMVRAAVFLARLTSAVTPGSASSAALTRPTQ